MARREDLDWFINAVLEYEKNYPNEDLAALIAGMVDPDTGQMRTAGTMFANRPVLSDINDAFAALEPDSLTESDDKTDPDEGGVARRPSSSRDAADRSDINRQRRKPRPPAAGCRTPR